MDSFWLAVVSKLWNVLLPSSPYGALHDCEQMEERQGMYVCVCVCTSICPKLNMNAVQPQNGKLDDDTYPCEEMLHGRVVPPWLGCSCALDGSG